MENNKEKLIEDMSDDEAVLELEKSESNDKVLESANLAALISQSEDENLIYYKVEGLFKDEQQKSYRSKMSLRRKPPVLEIKDMNDNTVRFLLTENLVAQLTNSLEDVQKAYYGYVPKKKKDPITLRELPTRIMTYAQENPLKVAITLLAIIVVVVALVI